MEEDIHHVENHQQKNQNSPSFQPYVDQKGWIRVLSKVNQQLKLQFRGQLTVDNLFKFKDFGISNSEETMNTTQSWYIQNVQMGAGIVKNIDGYPIQYMNSQIINLKQVIVNVFNGKTPTGSNWSQAYNEGYLFYKGKISTYGDWKQFYQGCNWNSTVKIGQVTSLHSGGCNHHTGQFIHSNCNGYDSKNHSITSRWDWNNTRVFWVRM